MPLFPKLDLIGHKLQEPIPKTRLQTQESITVFVLPVVQTDTKLRLNPIHHLPEHPVRPVLCRR